MTRDLRPRRLLLSAVELELLRREVLPAPLSLPPGFPPVGDGEPPAPGGPARTALRERGVMTEAGVHPAVADDLRVLAAPDLAVTVRAFRPGLEVTACVAVSGLRGAALLHTGGAVVELSAFAAQYLARELARVVPAPRSPAHTAVEEVPLDVLLSGGTGTRLRGRVSGTLHASVLTTAAGDGGAVVGSVEWVWDGRGWTGLEPLPSRGGRPWVRLAPVTPADLGTWLGPLLAAAAS